MPVSSLVVVLSEVGQGGGQEGGRRDGGECGEIELIVVLYNV